MTRQASGPPPSGLPGGIRGGAQLATPIPTGLIGRYQILDKIGEGGMGSLFLARDPAIDRLVAIKLLRHGLDTEPLRERFAREARAAGRLRHPHIVTIFDVGEHDGDPFIAMEFLAGETLAELIRDGARLSLSRRLKLIEELCDGLGYAHRSGLVHRDVKPANLMVDADGVLKILDFGIVRVTDSGMTQAGVLVGTVNYMSPEQVVGSAVDHRSDIFAVGLVAYELISGKQAFSGTLRDGLLNKILNGAPEPLVSVAPGIDTEVVSIVEQALQKDPANRYQDLVRMRNDLARVRVRLEREEELAAAAAAAEAGETAVIGEHATLAVDPPKRPPVPGIAHEAEQALASGNFRAALTLAGRSAALNPQDRVASSIAARAEAALLDRGRLLQSGAPVSPPASSASAASVPASGSAVQTGGGHVIWIAVAIAVVALGIAISALWQRTPSGVPAQVSSDKPATVPQSAESRSTPPPQSESVATPAQSAPPPPVSPASDPESKNPGLASTPPPTAPVPEAEVRGGAPPAGVRGGAARGRRDEQERRPTSGGRSTPPSAPAVAAPTPAAPPPAAPPPSAPPAAERPTGPLRVGTDTSAPKPAKPLEQPEASGSGGTVGVELTIGTDGHVSDARVLRSVPPGLDQVALAAVKRWEFQPVRLDGQAYTVIYRVEVNVPAAPPPAPKPSAPAPPPAPATTKPAETGRAAAPQVADQSDEIRAVLARHKAAWESLNFEALERVQVLSGTDAAIVRRTMADAREYDVDLTIKGISIDPSGGKATVQVTMIRRFTPKIGRAPNPRPASEVRLEKRGDAWMIIGIR